MKTVEQKVELYFDVIKAENDIKKHINSDWRVHTCTACGNVSYNWILVVYEKELESWS